MPLTLGFYWSLKAHRHWNSIPKHNTVQSVWLSALHLWQMWRFINGRPSMALNDILYTVLEEKFWFITSSSFFCPIQKVWKVPLFFKLSIQQIYKGKIAKNSVTATIYQNGKRGNELWENWRLGALKFEFLRYLSMSFEVLRFHSNNWSHHHSMFQAGLTLWM